MVPVVTVNIDSFGTFFAIQRSLRRFGIGGLLCAIGEMPLPSQIQNACPGRWERHDFDQFATCHAIAAR